MLMKSLLLTAGLALLSAPAMAQVRSGAEAWGPAPPGLPAGAQVAVLAGDPAQPGPFVMRAKMPAGYKVPPHWHPTDENLTLISGDLTLGMGDKLDVAGGSKLGPGDFLSLKAKMTHFAVTSGGAVLQISSTGPFEINYVNPADDPRKAK